jgi:signal transduction histidine kinase
MKVGDVAGAMSIVMPVDTYLNDLRNNIIQQAVLFAALLVVCLATIFWAVSKLVTRPLAKLETVAQQIEKGDFAVDVTDIGWRDEISQLSLHISKMAQELSGFYGELESKVSQRTLQLEEANRELDYRKHQLEFINEKLQKDSEYKSEYLAIMSHELRTPLTSILAFADMWESDPGEKTAKDTHTVQEIKINGQILLNIVNNILEMSRLEAGNTELFLEQVDMVDIFGIVERTIKPLADKKEIETRFSVDSAVPVIRADWEKLRRIVENLVTNAVKYTHRGGKVTVRAYLLSSKEMAAKDDFMNEYSYVCGKDLDASRSYATIEISDDGIGIQEETISHVFEKFKQDSQSAYRRYKGSGLGLAVVKELVELHGGTIGVQSASKKGSKFTVLLPVEAREEGDLL